MAVIREPKSKHTPGTTNSALYACHETWSSRSGSGVHIVTSKTRNLAKCTVTENSRLKTKYFTVCKPVLLSWTMTRSWDQKKWHTEAQSTQDSLLRTSHSHKDIPPPKKKIGGRVGWQANNNVTCHARNTLTKDGGSLLSFGPPNPKRSAALILSRKFKIVV